MLMAFVLRSGGYGFAGLAALVLGISRATPGPL
jgi:hypothetical protein